MDSLPPWALVRELSLSLLLPSLGISLIVMAAVCAATRSTPRRLLGGALALAGGLIAGNFFRGLLSWWSVEKGWPALFPATLAIIVGATIAALLSARGKQGRGLMLRFVIMALAAFWIAPGDSPLSRLGYFALIFAASAANLEMLQRPGRVHFGTKLLLAVAAIWGGSAATVLIAAQSARFSEMAMLLAASLGGAGVAALFWKLDLVALLAAPAIFYPALMLNGRANTFSEVPAASFILIALAPCALLVLRWPMPPRWPAPIRHAAPFIALLLPCALAVLLALRAEPLDFSGH